MESFCPCEYSALKLWYSSLTALFSEGNGPVLHKLVDCLESPTTHDIFSSDDLAMLSSWLEMRDAFRDPSGWANPIVDKYKEIYPRIKAAFDKIESKMPGYQDTRHVKVWSST